jgi:hypothetical protein
MAELAARLKQRAYNLQQGDGFVLEQVRSTHLVARYVERVHRVDEVFDPFGNPETSERFEYRRHQFRISTDGPGLELMDPTRNPRTLIGRLLELTDFGLLVAPISVDPWVWTSEIQALLGTSGIVDRVQARNVQIDADALASVQIDARIDALSAFQRFVRQPDFRLDKVRIRFPLTGGTLMATSAGGLEVTRGDADTVIDLARASLSQMSH